MVKLNSFTILFVYSSCEFLHNPLFTDTVMQKRLVCGGTGVLYAKPSCKWAHFLHKRTLFVKFYNLFFYSTTVNCIPTALYSLGLPSSVSSCGDRAQPAKTLLPFTLFFKTQLLNYWDFLKTFLDYYLILISVPLISIWIVLPGAFLFLSGTDKPVFCLCPGAAAAIRDEEPGLQGNNDPSAEKDGLSAWGGGQNTMTSLELRVS